ncbi:hypothetical protein P3551_22680 [Vibrio parahaemolyticus]|uniref:hypothetical protein n=1 Tax=Vibrio parahaemolyticus TaxID=670 RepID=UPI0011215E5C|nr:hypothetical protein [Vibrio parahaemolyticus]MCI9692369.1 hypothetical protein [Vibrio parahaemolyticus]MDF4902093.1 hypothetical protein [Vibrio parahaemolyticus]
MNVNFIKSLVIGFVLGIAIVFFQIDSSTNGFIASLFFCVAMGFITVIAIDEKPHVYSLVAALASGIFLCVFYGFNLGGHLYRWRCWCLRHIVSANVPSYLYSS